MTRALAAEGHEVTVAVPVVGPDDGSAGRTVPAAIVSVPPPSRRGPRWVRELAEVRHSRRLFAAAPRGVDLLWERHSLHADGGWRWARQHGIPRLLELDAPLLLERQATDPVALPALARHLEEASLRHAQHVFAVSRWLVTWATARGAASVHHLANGTQRPQRLPSPGTGVVLGYVGSCRAWHGLDRLPALLDALPGARAIVNGEGPCPPPSDPRIERRPPTADLDAALSGVSVAIAPGEAPPWVCPLKLLDYRARGLPIVASDVGDARELVGDAGEVLPATASIDQWAAAVRRQAGRTPAPWLRTWRDVAREALGRVALA